MKLTTAHILPLVFFPAFVLAHAGHHHYHRAVAASSTGSSSAPRSTTGTSVPGTGTGLSTTIPARTVSVTLLSTNPTAVPLQSIGTTVPSAPTMAVPTHSPGSKPPGISNAPGVPDLSTLLPSNYPPLDKVPDTSSPEVQEWIQAVMDTNIPIPAFNPTQPGGCSANVEAAANSSRCWWTCGGCTRSTDITTCLDKAHWGLTSDDGPANHTMDLISYLALQNLTSTLFVVGSRVISSPAILQHEYLLDHQIGAHTWSHTSLTTQTNEQIIAELGWSKKVIRDVIGVTPNTMRPPYGDIDDRVRAICKAMDLTPIIWTRNSAMTFDTNDWNIASGGTTSEQVVENFAAILAAAGDLTTGFITLSHDLWPQTVDMAVGYFIPDAVAQGNLTIETVAKCRHLTLADSYIETNDNSSNPLPSTVDSSNGTNSSAGSSGGNSTGTAKKGSDAVIDVKMDAIAAAVVVVFGAITLTL